MPKLEVLRLLGRNVSSETTVRHVTVSKEAMRVRLPETGKGVVLRWLPLTSLRNCAEPALPSWLSKLSPEMHELVKEESRNGRPYLRLARRLKMQDLPPAELQAIIETWMDAKRRYEREFGRK